MTMPEYMNKEVFLSSMGLTGDETKYGNRDAEHQHRSYSTYMSYEIMDSVDDSIVEEELAPVRHGRWEEADWIECSTNDLYIRTPRGAHRCSECKRCFKKELLWKDNYCPNCGAKMDLEG